MPCECLELDQGQSGRDTVRSRHPLTAQILSNIALTFGRPWLCFVTGWINPVAVNALLFPAQIRGSPHLSGTTFMSIFSKY